eukprot:2313123-Alexandrium_andersonii.AAC.1
MLVLVSFGPKQRGEHPQATTRMSTLAIRTVIRMPRATAIGRPGSVGIATLCPTVVARRSAHK